MALQAIKEELVKLKELKDAGVLTDDEYIKEKEKMLSKISFEKDKSKVTPPSPIEKKDVTINMLFMKMTLPETDISKYASSAEKKEKRKK